MNTNYFRVAYASSISLLFLGLLMIFTSGSRGQSVAAAELARQFNSMDTAQYNMIYEAGINQFLILGGIFTGSGLLIAILVSLVLLINSKPLPAEELNV